MKSKQHPSPPSQKKCPYCNGKGKVTRVVMQADNEEYVTSRCIACLGTGKAR